MNTRPYFLPRTVESTAHGILERSKALILVSVFDYLRDKTRWNIRSRQLLQYISRRLFEI
jgi:hypothetical protein